MTAPTDQAFIRQMRLRMEEEIGKKEKETLAYWRSEVEKIRTRSRQDLASMLSDLDGLLARMDRRLKQL